MSLVWIASVNETVTSDNPADLDHDKVLAEITRGMVSGRESAFSNFCQRYSQALHRYCLRVVKGNEADSYELHQQVLIRIAKYPKEISDEKALWRWMARVVRTTVIDIHRKQKRYGLAMKAYWEHVTATPSSFAANDSSLSSALLEVLSETPEPDREILEKKYLAGWSYQAIAEKLELTPKAVESRLTRARIRLRERTLQRIESDKNL